ncbi:glycosyltransferase family 20 protein [Schizophyllum commune]
MATTDHVRQQIRELEEINQKQGLALSGRVIHVCHYLPVTAALKTPNASGLISPPATPPVRPSDLESKTDGAAKHWTLGVRYGHAAMISGIKSLSRTRNQVIIGWTGDIPRAPASAGATAGTSSAASVPSNAITQEDKDALVEALAEYSKNEPQEECEGAKHEIGYVPVWLDDKVAHGHYDGYCKQTLWPLFHYLLWQDVASEQSQASAYYQYYVQANRTFAEKICETYRPGDLIWIHDYHLLLVPKFIREIMREKERDGTLGCKAEEVMIGFFIHTPFPSSEVYRCLPERKQILDGILGANLVCFQTYSYARHFLSTCVRVCGYETTTAHTASSITKSFRVDEDSSGGVGVDVQGHVTIVEHCPVGIDAERVGRDILRPGIQPKLEALMHLYEGKKIIVGRDKLDVVKGVLQKLRAFRHLLLTYPQWIGKVVMIQVTSPSLTDSPKLEKQVSELVSQINGEFGSLDFIPCHHYHQTLKKDEFYALLSVADLALITPLRDGMNTTSMEFVVAQERTKKSPCVLSEFMGISRHMAEALLVNPWDLGDVAAAIDRGLTMADPERSARHAKLYEKVTTHTSHTWAALLVKMLVAHAGGLDAMMKPSETPYIDTALLKAKYTAASKRLFLFDYDGTLAPIVKTPSAAVPTPQVLRALEKLSADPKNVVYIISGRDGQFLEQHLGHLENVGFSAEHGGFVRPPKRENGGSSEWMNFTERLDMSWMSEVEEIFKYYTERTTGSTIEVKKSSITWHYRNSDPEWGEFQCRQCQDLLENNLANKRPIEVMLGKKNLEVRPMAINKGEIVKRIVYQNPDAEFVFCAGDDKTDEDMFRALLLFPNTPGRNSGSSHIRFEAPLSVTLTSDAKGQDFPPVELHITRDAIFTTAVGHSSKRTLASWHVTAPEEVVDNMLRLVGEEPERGKVEGAKAESNL